jgi:hypothetical protein
MKTFCYWNKDWQQPFKVAGPRGDSILEERLKIFLGGIKLIYSEKLLWIQSVKFGKQKGKNGYYLIAINKHYK